MDDRGGRGEDRGGRGDRVGREDSREKVAIDPSRGTNYTGGPRMGGMSVEGGDRGGDRGTRGGDAGYVRKPSHPIAAALDGPFFNTQGGMGSVTGGVSGGVIGSGKSGKVTYVYLSMLHD